MQDNPVLNFLAERRSVLARNMSDPGPDPTALKTLLSIATRVPDHGKLTPWRLVVVQDDDRKELGDIAARELTVTNGEPNAVETAREQFMRALHCGCIGVPARASQNSPQRTALFSRCRVHDAGTARAAGFAAQWLTGAAAYNGDVLARLGGGEEDEIAGFIYLGSCTEKPAERARPELEDIACFGLPETDPA